MDHLTVTLMFYILICQYLYEDIVTMKRADVEIMMGLQFFSLSECEK
jgi:hypothetical protein